VRRHTPSRPSHDPSAALVFIHGGGFTYGTLDELEVPMRLIAERAGIVTYAVDYQPAPEAKYPTQPRIALGGDSAGGNMTCVIALKLRDEHGPRLALQVPLFPEAAFPDDGRHPYVTPMNAESHAGLPPTILVTNGFATSGTSTPAGWPPPATTSPTCTTPISPTGSSSSPATRERATRRPSSSPT
jgi:acetyl esterase/lipase